MTNFNDIVQVFKIGNSKFRTFFLFFLVSAIFWLLIKLSVEYKIALTFPVKYVELPKDKIFQSKPQRNIKLSVKSTGFNLVTAKLFPETLQLNLTTAKHKSGYTYYILPNQQIEGLKNQVSRNMQLYQVVDDSLFVNLGAKKTVKVPVIYNTNIQYKLGYSLSGSLLVDPDSITVSGPEAKVDQITSIQAEPLELKEISENFTTELSFILPEKEVEYSHTSATLSGNVEKYTEGSVKVSFEVTNLPNELTIITYPKILEIVFQTGLSNFQKVNSSSFKVVCDYSEAIRKNVSYLTPTVVMHPSYVSSIIVKPVNIEFLIHKKSE